jgi:hypothetical protein
MRSPSTASSACRFSLRNSGGSERAVSSGITCGGLLKTLPTTPTASLPRRCASCAPGNSATSTCLRRKILTGHAVNSLIRARGSEADGHDCSYAAGPRADRVTARQSQGGAHISRRGHTPARMRGRGCTAGRSRALGRLQAGSVRRAASPDCFRGTGSVHSAARRRARGQPTPTSCCMRRWASPSRRSPAPSRRAVTSTGNRPSTPASWCVSSAACGISPAGCPPRPRLAANGAAKAGKQPPQASRRPVPANRRRTWTWRRIRGESHVARTFAQLTDLLADICKTVGLAYVGSNPTPATTHSPSSDCVTKIIWCAQGERSVTPSTQSGPNAH